MQMNETREKATEAFGQILIKQGYDWVDLEKVGETTSIELKDLQHEFPNKALLCASWMEMTDVRARKHHADLLSSGRSERAILEQYFAELENFMNQYGFKGCPFTNTARAIRDKSEPEIEQRIREHKGEMRQFFLRLCERVCSGSGHLGEALFLIYSGATTESANLHNMKPIQSGREASLALFDLYSQR